MKFKFTLSLCLMTCCLTAIFLNLSAHAISYPEITAPVALVMDPASGEILYQKNPDQKMYPASTTKMMTALLAIELGNMADNVTILKEDLTPLNGKGGAINLKADEVLTLKQLLYYLLVASGNDAANVIARHIGGDVESFVMLMNRRAKELGCTGTNFVNPHGLHDSEHYTTARDLYIIAKEAMTHELFADACKTSRYVLEPTSSVPNERVFYTTNHLISRWRNVSYIYSKAIGIKTGSTTEAGNCLVSAATSKESTYYCVVLGASKNEQTEKIMSFVESTKLLEWAFSSYSVKTILTTDEPIQELPVELSPTIDYVVAVPKTGASKLMLNDIAATDLERKVTLPDKIEAPITKGQVLGTITLSYEGTEYATVDLVASTSVDRSNWLYSLSLVQNFLSSKVFKIAIVIIIALIIILLVLLSSKKKHGKRSPRRNRRM